MTQPVETKGTSAREGTDPQSAGFRALDRRSSSSIDQRRIDQLDRAAAHRAPPDPKDLVSTGIMWVLTLALAVAVIVAFDILLAVFPSGAAPATGSTGTDSLRILWGQVPISISAN